jgi:hypothetical protein
LTQRPPLRLALLASAGLGFATALLAGGAAAQALRAEAITPRNVRETQIGGPDAIGGLLDYYLANDRIELVIDHPDRRHGMVNHGGGIVDAGLRDRENEDQFARLVPLVNLSQRVFVDYDAIRAELDPEGAFARVIVTSSGMSSLPRGEGLGRALDPLVPDPQELAAVRVETVYEVRPGEDFARLRTRFDNTGSEPAPVFAYGDLWMRGGRSLRAFLGNAAHPELARGFEHRSFSAQGILGSVGAFASFSHVVMAGLPAYPPIAYALFSPERSARGLSFFGVSGEHVSLVCSFVGDPGWEALSIPRLLGALGGGIEPGGHWEIERRLLVTGRSDVASATDRILPELLGGEGVLVEGSVTPPDVRTAVHVDSARGEPLTQVLAEDGRYALRLPPGRYRLRLRAAHRPPVLRELSVPDTGSAQVEAVHWPQVGALRFEPAFEDGGPGRVVVLGVDGSPAPVFGEELLDFRLDGRALPSATETHGISFVGTDTDPREVALPAGRYRLVATRGLEWDVDQQEVEVAAGQAARVRPFRLARVAALPDHVAADFHVHAQASDDSGTTNLSRLRDFVAAGMQVLVATDHENVADYDEAKSRLGLVDAIRVVRGVEVTSSAPSEQAPYTLGHRNAWPIAYQPWAHRHGAPPSQRLSAGDLQALLRGEYRAEVVQLNHPRGKEPGVYDGNFLTHQGGVGRPADPTLPLSAPANAALLVAGADGTRPIDFDVIELMNGSSTYQYREVRKDFHWLLRQGHRVAATANTDTHGPDEPAGLPRNYVRVGTWRGNVQQLDEALRAGRSFGTNGPLVTRFAVAGGRPGDEVSATDGRVSVDYEVVAAPWVPLDEVRLLVNGEVVRVLREASGRLELPLGRDAFVTLEAGAPIDADPEIWRARHRGVYSDALAPGFLPTAFTNPVYVDADGDGRWTPPGLPEPGRALAPTFAGLAIAAAAVGMLAVPLRRRRRNA